MSRKKDRRHKAILDQLSVTPTMRVSRLAEVLEVTTETIRRDLEELAAQDLISRTYGGAMLRQPMEPVLSERHKALVDERAAIGRAAVPLLSDARVLMLGSGATTTQLAKRIAFEMNNITVIAHSFSVATALAFNPTIQIVMAPGVYHSGEGALHGAQTVRFLSDYSADWSVTGASAISPLGPSDALMEAGDVYATMLRQSARHMVLADHSKFDRMATARYSDWTDVDVLVSDARPQGPLARALQVAGVELRLVSV
ncbi:MAG: DeoR/GlpR transcriptional regulator [Rhodobacteraceae bacterium]|jgi:DeoR/GlpR family transcriptional regulator of sugar metabolism|uniref:Transcriptional regulator of sugar metabolism n=1 Tax=Salipiger profundus TaxID=1229727 RepID=A0A1U7D7S0_9RHOB|nr:MULTISPECIES: DeoR/GlpR family DNA-binding transcription regulator [Salipiger]APX24158.1 transcriptional regulator of sugar metabolism [Salipiger profundus]MAB07351.1 DeoR/GlpR transcriptional regulator [Paracoccaceae bacterium]GFZ95037.1 DeoR family transcriptional regulator [Salipiger profundus]SFB89341.1 transcriptional regulator, DeoR family [Salipiger profundus]